MRNLGFDLGTAFTRLRGNEFAQMFDKSDRAGCQWIRQQESAAVFVL
jgi:hypothetical protein